MTATFVEPADDEYLETAFTRAEIMRARGYGNGQVELEAETDHVQPQVLESQRTCVVCGRIITGKRASYPQTRTCSEECGQQREKNRPRQQRKDLSVVPVPIANGSECSDRVVALTLALATAGQRVQLSVDGVVLVVGA